MENIHLKVLKTITHFSSGKLKMHDFCLSSLLSTIKFVLFSSSLESEYGWKNILYLKASAIFFFDKLSYFAQNFVLKIQKSKGTQNEATDTYIRDVCWVLLTLSINRQHQYKTVRECQINIDVVLN